MMSLIQGGKKRDLPTSGVPREYTLKKKRCHTELKKGSRFGYHFKNPLRFEQNWVQYQTFISFFYKGF